MNIQFKNNAAGTLGANILAGDLSIALTAGHGARFPVLVGPQYFYLDLIDSSLNIEIIKVTARVVDTLTVVRGQDGTIARAYSTSDRAELRFCNACITDMAAEILAAATAVAAASWTTGDVKLAIKTVADTGWVMCNDGTIGNAASLATTRANADTAALFAQLWNLVSDTYAPVLPAGRGANAAADFAANKTIGLTKMLGRALAIAGAGSGLTARSLGQILGAETHVLTLAESPPHDHTIAGGTIPVAGAPNVITASDFTGSPVTSSAGGGAAHNNMPPESFLNAMIKL